MISKVVPVRPFLGRFSLSFIAALTSAIGLAWFCAFFATYSNRGEFHSYKSMDGEDVEYFVLQSWGSELGIRGADMRFALALSPEGPDITKSYSQVRRSPGTLSHAPLPEKGIFAYEAHGWLALCFQWRYKAEDERGNALLQYGIDVGGGTRSIQINTSPKISVTAPMAINRYVLPLMPIWSGLLIDCAVFTATWIALGSVLIFTKRRIRSICGLCPMCAYDLRHDMKRRCSECGWTREAVKSSSDAGSS